MFLENDFIMRQIKLAGEGIAVMLKKEISKDSLGEIQREDGSFVSRMDLILDHLKNRKIQEAFQLVNSLKYKTSYYEFEQISSWFIKLLKSLQKEAPSLLDDLTIEAYQNQLDDLL